MTSPPKHAPPFLSPSLRSCRFSFPAQFRPRTRSSALPRIHPLLQGRPLRVRGRFEFCKFCWRRVPPEWPRILFSTKPIYPVPAQTDAQNRNLIPTPFGLPFPPLLGQLSFSFLPSPIASDSSSPLAGLLSASPTSPQHYKTFLVWKLTACRSRWSPQPSPDSLSFPSWDSFLVGTSSASCPCPGYAVYVRPPAFPETILLSRLTYPIRSLGFDPPLCGPVWPPYPSFALCSPI